MCGIQREADLHIHSPYILATITQRTPNYTTIYTLYCALIYVFNKTINVVTYLDWHISAECNRLDSKAYELYRQTVELRSSIIIECSSCLLCLFGLSVEGMLIEMDFRLLV